MSPNNPQNPQPPHRAVPQPPNDTAAGSVPPHVEPEAGPPTASESTQMYERMLHDVEHETPPGFKMTPELLQALMVAKIMAAEMRKPSPEEADKLAKERDRLLRARQNAAEAGKQVADQIKDQQSRCAHIKPNGEHTWRGQVHSDGWATIRCVRCLKPYKVRPTPEMVSSGLNLNEVTGLTEQHLKQWAANSAKMEAFYAPKPQPQIDPFATEEAFGSI